MIEYFTVLKRFMAFHIVFCIRYGGTLKISIFGFIFPCILTFIAPHQGHKGLREFYKSEKTRF